MRPLVLESRHMVTDVAFDDGRLVQGEPPGGQVGQEAWELKLGDSEEDIDVLGGPRAGVETDGQIADQGVADAVPLERVRQGVQRLDERVVVPTLSSHGGRIPPGGPLARHARPPQSGLR